ncbi:MAG: glycoside hydrolase family 5 protein [Bacillati bacterium ANGP1]|uniref:Glycoside hydrolase family 5 protein n=1 Tax=Candidatus Segetimicrobium genomatis TaxID=2569760 RepID=A0A537K383_9BACT|nr:MAG: glycoside hydrolase family 5 protein [Terrabacteria group bacterium ANGP1]
MTVGLVARTLLALTLIGVISVYGGGAFAAGVSPSASPGIEAFPPMAGTSPPGGSGAAWATAAAMGRGVNFGNMLEGTQEGVWVPWGALPVRDEFIDVTAAAGFATVRLPVRWSNHAAAATPFTIDPAFFTRVESIIDKLLAKGLYVVLDMHHYHQLDGDPLDSGEFAVDNAVLDVRFLSLWQQIAGRFSGKSNRLLFDLYNEPHGRLNASKWNDLAARALNAVRRSNPTRIVVIGAADFDLSSLSVPNDANLIVTFHNYSPLSFTHQGAEWVSPMLPTGVSCCNSSQQAAALAPINQAKAWSDARHYPVFLGEFGAYHKADMASRVNWTRFVRDQSESRGIPWCYWELAWGFGVYDPDAHAWRAPLKDALLGSGQTQHIALVQQAANSGANITALTVTLPQVPQAGDVLVVANVSNNNQVDVSGGGVSSWNYIWSQVRENTVIVYGIVDSSPSAALTMRLIGAPSPGDLSSIVSEWSGLSGTLDGLDTATGPASPIATAAMATANGNDLLISVGGDTGGMLPGWWTAFSAAAQQPHAKIEAAYQVVSAAGRYANTWSDTGSTGWDAAIAALPGNGIALVQQAANSGAGLTALTVTLPQVPRAGDVLIVTNVSNNRQVSVSGGGVSSWNYIWSQARENTVIVYGTVGGSPSAALTMRLIGAPSPGDLSSIVSEWSGLSGTLDGSGTATGPASPIATAAVSTANANDLLISVGGDTGGMLPGWWTAFTAPAQPPHAKIEAAYQVVSAAGRYANTWSDTGSIGWEAVIGALR